MTGLVFDIQRFSLHDGPGIRTTVFLKGCPLRCYWCQNPEGLTAGKSELQFFKSRCIRCGDCFKVCPEEAHRIVDNVHIVDQERCTNCGKCAEVCPSKALVMAGKDMTVEDVVEEVAQDEIFFGYSEGGVTLSGGDPLLQVDFAHAVLSACKERGIHTAIESALNVNWDSVEKMLPVTDLVMCDLKHIDSDQHKLGTGVPLDKIMSNMKRLSETGKPMIVRIPVVPEFNDSEEVMGEMIKFIKTLPSVQYIELLEYHRLGEYKYDALGKKCDAKDLPRTPKARMEAFVETAKKENLKVKALV